MKKQFFIVIAFILSINSFAQDLASLKVGIQKIYSATTTLDYDVILESTYPKLFEIVEKEKMKEVLVSTFNGSEEMKVKLLSVDPEFSFGKIKKIGTKTFCLINHNLAMQLIFKDTIEDSKIFIKEFKKSMDTKSVTYDKETNSFTIIVRSTMIGIHDEYTNNEWRFLNKEKGNVLFDKLFDEAVKKELGL